MISREQLATTAAVAALAGAAGAYAVLKCTDPCGRHSESLFKRLPNRIILVRHGESEGNCDETLYRTKADNLVELTCKGSEQAIEAGKRLRAMIPRSDILDFHVSPFQRTLQTCRGAAKVFEGQVRFTHVDSRIREQEFGNLQGEEFTSLRELQKKVGRFFFRFPQGESGADVFDRTSQWWESFFGVTGMMTRSPPDTSVVFTHGLTMRFILMQLFSWSVDTFHTVWNAGNCNIYVLTKDLSLQRRFPYRLDPIGDMPKSSMTVTAELLDGTSQELLLSDYLDIPAPRTIHPEFAARMLETQHSLAPNSIKSVDFFKGKHGKFK